jgi:hypothetical protein
MNTHIRKLSISRAEYWFLDAAIELRVKVDALNPDYTDLESLLNRPHHNLSHRQVAETLYHLYQHGDIIFLSDPEFDTHRYWEYAVPVTLTEIEDAVFGQGRTYLFYLLTLQGGALWETCSNPDWSRFFNTSSYEGIEIVCGGSREVVERYTFIVYYRQPIIEESKVWTELLLWQATYWKTLPRGHRLDFRYKHLAPWEKQIDEPSWVNKEWIALNRWYANYLDT